jgi:glutamyl-tRNA synthetase
LRLAPDELGRRLQPLLDAAGLWNPAYLGDRHAWYFAVLELLRPRAKRLDDYLSLGRFFFADTVEFDEAAVVKHLRTEGMHGHLRALGDAWASLPAFDQASVERALREVAEVRGVKPATLIHAVRVAVTGKAASPGLFEVLALVGRERTLTRLESAAERVTSPRV